MSVMNPIQSLLSARRVNDITKSGMILQASCIIDMDCSTVLLPSVNRRGMNKNLCSFHFQSKL